MNAFKEDPFRLNPSIATVRDCSRESVANPLNGESLDLCSEIDKKSIP